MGIEGPATRFLIISGTHSLDLAKHAADPDTINGQNRYGNRALPTADVVLHCGDLTDNGGLQEHIRNTEGLANLAGAELTLVIPGNHDVDLDRDFYPRSGGDVSTAERVTDLWRAERVTSAGTFLLDEGVHDFTLRSGASFKIYASPYTPSYGSSAFQYPTREDRFNETQTPPWATNTATKKSVILAAVEIVMTHGPPQYILDNCEDGSSGGCEHLRRAICNARPLLHCFGHIHNAWGARCVQWAERGEGDEEGMILMPEEFIGKNSCRKRGYATLGTTVYKQVKAGEQTLFVNAAVGNEDGRMQNVPWLVDLVL